MLVSGRSLASGAAPPIVAVALSLPEPAASPYYRSNHTKFANSNENYNLTAVTEDDNTGSTRVITNC